MPGTEGVYSILDNGVRTDDAQFARIYAEACAIKRRSGSAAPQPPTEVKVAVLDSGIVSKDDAYFSSRMAGSGDAQGGVGVQMTNGLPSTEGQHGSHVASIACSGTTMIKILDVQVASTQEGGKVTLNVWATAFKWAVEQRARIVNVSIVCPWGDPSVKGIVETNTGVLFLATSGNANNEYGAQYRTANGFDNGNVILVGGCARNGNRQDQRGYGDGIDIFVPSMKIPGLVSKKFAQERDFGRAVKYRNDEDGKLNLDRKNIGDIREKLSLDPGNKRLQAELKREEGRLKRGEAQLPVLPANASLYPVSDQDQVVVDDGVSFGIPMVANVAAKMMLIMPNLTPKETITIIKQTGEACAVGAVLDPVRCYQAALEKRREWAGRI